MVILSYEFALSFLVFFVVYWALYRSIYLQNAWLILAGLAFLASWQLNFVLSLLFVWAIGQFASLSFAKKPKQKWLLISSITVLVVHLCFFKYFNFAIAELNDTLLRHNNASPLDIALPIGISFYTFQTISYLVDVYKERIKPMPSAVFLGFLAFVPTLTSGPIFRAAAAKDQWLPPNQTAPKSTQELTLKEKNELIAYQKQHGMHTAHPDFIKSIPARRSILLPYLALSLIVFALFKKIVLAGHLEAIWVSPVFANPSQFHGLEVLTAIYAYSLQLFFDFSGYTDLVLAIALLLGFQLPQNFNQPYLATDIQDFWNRWHMTLSQWIRDYLYIPLGGSRTSFWRTQFNIMASFLISGFWHGAGWNFLIWGGIHGLALVWLNTLKRFGFRYKLTQKAKWLAIFITFHYVAFGWVFFHSNTPTQAFDMLAALGNWHTLFSLPILPTLILMAMAWLIYPKLHHIHDHTSTLFQRLPWWSLPLWIALYITLIFGLAPDGLPNFIYANF